MTPDQIAVAAELAMLIELSSDPKPGNVDRQHDFEDIGFFHFAASAACSYPAFRKAAANEGRVGELILEAVRSWKSFGLPSNTHFGSLALMIPLAVAAGASSGEKCSHSRAGEKDNGSAHDGRRYVSRSSLHEQLQIVLWSTDYKDAIAFYSAFELCGARVIDVDQFSLKDGAKGLESCKESLISLMRLSRGHDLIAREWSDGYRRSFALSEKIATLEPIYGINDAVVIAYISALSEEPDSLVYAKHGKARSQEISDQASAMLQQIREGPKDERAIAAFRRSAAQMDRQFLLEDINPGSTADLIGASLFIAFLGGLRF